MKRQAETQTPGLDTQDYGLKDTNIAKRLEVFYEDSDEDEEEEYEEFEDEEEVKMPDFGSDPF